MEVDKTTEAACFLRSTIRFCIYEKNVQGDVMLMLDSDGKIVVNYVYNTWGKVTQHLDGKGVGFRRKAGISSKLQ